ncbi:MAG TPA: efflux RND transporter periplasmic adaptor subunit, partial [Rubrivivax sp.]|nr:efflux RND transporter periplasmic adaptor subunit [Rubrivivax sp.]
LASQATGLIARLDVDRGDMVRRGQVLGTLSDEVERANLDLARARASNDHEIAAGQARLAWLQRKSERASQLATGNLVSRNASEEAEADMKVAENQLRLAVLNHRIAQLELAQAEAVLRQRALVSPVDGVVMERLLRPGEYRHDQSPVFTLAQVDPLRVEVFMPAAYHGQVRPGMVGRVQPDLPGGQVAEARVTVVDPVMDAASGTFGVRLTLANPDLALPAGVRCTVRFQADSAR